MTKTLAQDLKVFQAADGMFYFDRPLRQRTVGFFFLLGERMKLRGFLGQMDFAFPLALPSTLITRVQKNAHLLWDFLAQGLGFLKDFVIMPLALTRRRSIQDQSIHVDRYLLLNGMAFLLARIIGFLLFLIFRPLNGLFRAIDNGFEIWIKPEKFFNRIEIVHK